MKAFLHLATWLSSQVELMQSLEIEDRKNVIALHENTFRYLGISVVRS